ncbi:unnamed protein product [Rotaria sp. Silwood2]|nr:unnamed protein product [Rotaria sp. Silwood2]
MIEKSAETKAAGTLGSRQSPQTTKRNEQGPSSTRTNESHKKSTKTDEQKSKTTKSDEQKTPKKDDATDKKPTQKTSSTTESSSDSSKNIEYTITVQTGSVQFAGTDANVFISLYGDKNKIVRYQLKTSVNHKDIFEKGQKDDFVVKDIDIGQLKTITIEHDGTGLASGWYLDFVQVKYDNNTVMFPVERWLDTNQDDKRISLELEPNKKPTSKLTTEDTKEANAVEYEITVRTGDKRSAGTDANVYISLFGDKDKLERRQLKESLDGARNLFEQGATNRFQIYAADVGKIKTIRIEHDGSGLGNGWYLDSIEVRHISHDETYKFPVDRWLDVGEGDKRISLDLEPDKKPGQLKGKKFILNI